MRNNKLRNIFSKIPRCIVFALPMFAFFLVVLLAYWPGILVSDSIFQWHQAQTGDITNWHPAYNTIYIMLLSKIINNPGFVLFVQITIMSLCIGSFLGKLEKYYGVNRIYLLICSFLLSLIPLNYNSAVVLLKDSLYSALLVLVASIIIDVINQEDFFKKIPNCLRFGASCLAVTLMRHNGILVIGLLCLIMIIIWKKKYGLYIVTASVLVLYFLMTTVGFTLLSVREDNYANKYGPISHIYARILNEDKSRLSEDELEKLSEFVDLERLESTYVPYNMDHSINSQKKEALQENGGEYLKMAIKEFFEGPGVFFRHYIFLDSYLYSPVCFENFWYVGMFVETDLWIYKDQYPQWNENSKIPGLLETLKEQTLKFQSQEIGQITMWPAWYMYATLALSLVFMWYYRNKKIILIGMVSYLNILSLAPAMPVAMTRYVYSTILIGYLFIIWAVYMIYSAIKKLIRAKLSKTKATADKKSISMQHNYSPKNTKRSTNMDKIAVLIPCYNEALTIEKVVTDWKTQLPEATIYVYDNNSSDNTSEIAEKAGAVVRYEYQQGKGNVIRRMFREIDAECYVMIDGDDTYPAEFGREMVQLVLDKKVDMVVGDRLSSTYFEENKRPFHNFGNTLVRGTINRLFKSDIRDIMTGYRAFSYQFVKSFPVLSKGFEIETEMSIHSVHNNMLVENVIIDYRDRPEGSESKLNTYSDGFKVLKTILRLYKNYKPGSFFGWLSAILLFIAAVMFAPILLCYFRTGLVPNFPTLIVSGFMALAGILSLFTGFILETLVEQQKQNFEFKLQMLRQINKE